MIELIYSGWMYKTGYENNREWHTYDGKPEKRMDCPNCGRPLERVSKDRMFLICDDTFGHEPEKCGRGYAFANRTVFRIRK